MTIVISLIGEQNLPNLLPILHLKPERVILVYTDFTEQTAVRLTKLIQPHTEVGRLSVDAYNIDETRTQLEQAVNGLPISEIIINFTGGTKMMSLAAYQTAVDLNAPMIYLKSEGKQSLLYWYKPENGRYSLQTTEDIPSLITIQKYLEAYLDEYKIYGTVKSGGRGQLFEEAVYGALDKPVMDEICAGVKMHNTVDIDFVVRCGNQVGIIETKATLKNTKKGIDQLNTAGGRAYLGTYTKKFFVCDQIWGSNLNDLRQIADDRRIKIIELPSFGQNDALSAADTKKLQTQIKDALGCAGRTAVSPSTEK